jgi:XisH protein
MARDIYHSNVRVALEKEGWIITHDSLPLRIADIQGEIDLGAEKLLTAERKNEKIAVEVKSFLSKSKLADWYEAHGKFRLYRKGLALQEPNRKLYLAVSQDIYKTFTRHFSKKNLFNLLSTKN